MNSQFDLSHASRTECLGHVVVAEDSAGLDSSRVFAIGIRRCSSLSSLAILSVLLVVIPTSRFSVASVSVRVMMAVLLVHALGAVVLVRRQECWVVRDVAVPV